MGTSSKGCLGIRVVVQLTRKDKKGNQEKVNHHVKFRMANPFKDPNWRKRKNPRKNRAQRRTKRR